MKPTRDEFTVESTVTGEAVAMGIREDAVAHIMGMLTEAYSDPGMAVVREYATNAWDANVEAGVDAPIRVTTPASLRPLFTVEDDGVGLSAEDIRDIYSQYGASTKRDTNDAVGMLGIGCKAALAYCDQFTLTSRKDGRRTVVMVSREAEGGGTMTILEDESTDEPNGTTVSIPAGMDNTLLLDCARLFAYWPEGSVLVDGQPVAPHVGYELTPELMVVDKRDLSYPDVNRAVVVMGGVPYPADDLTERDDFKLPGHKILIATVPIGAVEFAPSREALKDTLTTRAALDKLAKEFAEAKATVIQKRVDAAKTRGEAVAALVEAQDGLATDVTPKWRGKEIAETIEASKPPDDAPNRDMRFFYLPDVRKYIRSAESTHSREPRLSLKVASRAIWVTDYTNGTWTAAQRRRLDAYVTRGAKIHDALTDGTVEFVLTDGPLPSSWLDGVRTVSWPDVRAWKDPDAPSGGYGGAGAYAGTYPTYVSGGWNKKFPAAEYDPDLPMFYVVGRPGEHRPLRNALVQGYGDCYLVELSQPRLAKFLGLFPGAQEATPAAREAAETWWQYLLTQDQRDALHLPSDYRLPTGIGSLGLADPDIARYFRLKRTITKELQASYNLWARWLNEPTPKPTPPENPLTRYPLLQNVGRHDSLAARHAKLYVNAVYAAEPKESQ